MQISLSQFQLAASLSPALASRWYPHILSAMKEFGIDTPVARLRLLHKSGMKAGVLKHWSSHLITA